MVDKKVYKTDYKSDFTSFFQTHEFKEPDTHKAVNAEKDKYAGVFELRDNSNQKDSRNKLWENF